MHIALYRPEIPPNTGNIARLAVGMGCELHIVAEPSFSLSEAAVRRAGLDYWSELRLSKHQSFEEFLQWCGERPLKAVSKFGPVNYADAVFSPEDVILFGNETAGLPTEVLRHFKESAPKSILRIPMKPICRSLNLSNAVAVVMYEAWRQNKYV